MSYPAKTILAFGLYFLGLGTILVLVPNMLLALIQLPTTSEVWIRVVGMLVLFLGIHCVVAARSELRPFIVWSVPIRMSVIVFFGAFVLFGLVPPMLLLFGAIDLATAVWTWSALRSTPLPQAANAG